MIMELFSNHSRANLADYPRGNRQKSGRKAPNCSISITNRNGKFPRAAWFDSKVDLNVLSNCAIKLNLTSTDSPPHPLAKYPKFCFIVM